jgi:hypothetical protein
MHLVAPLSLAILALVVYGALYHTVVTKSVTVASLQNQIEGKTKAATRAASARAALAEIERDEALVRDYFVPETGVVAFIDNLEHRGETLGAKVNVSSVNTETSGATTFLVIQVSVTGPFDSVMRTVGAIEYAPYALQLSGTTLKLESKNLWNAQFTIRVGSVML